MDLHSDYPFWMIKEGILQSTPTLCAPHKTQILVIGGGITGALIAQHLVAAGLAVSVVEKRHLGHGSTSASTAMLQYEIDVPLFQLAKTIGEKAAVRTYKMCANAIEYLATITQKMPDKADFLKVPSLQYASFESHTEAIIKPEYTIRKKHGFEVAFCGPRDLQKTVGMTADSGILSQQAAQVNPFKLCNYLLADIQQKGNPVFDLSPIRDWETKPKFVRVRTKNGLEIHAEHIVVACGYETQSYVPKKVTDFNSSYAIVSKPLDTQYLWKKRALIWETKTPYLYMRTTADNRILVGGRDEVFYNPEKRDELIPQKRLLLEQDFKKLFPEVPFQTDFAWAGTFAETKDGLPYIGVFDEKRVHFAMGYGGNGILFSVIAAELILNEIKGRAKKADTVFGFNR